MDSANQLSSFFSNLFSQLNSEEQQNTACPDQKKCCLDISSAEILAIIGILGGVLKVDAVQIDRNQIVDIVLTGSLKRKTELDKIMDKLGEKNFKEVMTAFLEKFS